MEVVLGFGSNMGDRAGFLCRSVRIMEERIGAVKCKSSLYETAPWGFESDQTFYNQVVVFETRLQPEEVLFYCMETERLLGRERTAERYSSRVIDIDILFYASLIVEHDDLTIPHPRIPSRNFVLVPLCEIRPDFIHPVCHKKISGLLLESPDDSFVHKINPA